MVQTNRLWRAGLGVGATLLLGAGPAAIAATVGVSAAEAVTDCTPMNGYTHCQRYTYTGDDQTFAVPAGVTEVDAHAWAAGGGGAPGNYTPAQLTAGGGGYATGVIPVTGGGSLTVVVGQGGVVNSEETTYGGGGGGGAGGNANQTGASGGGMSGVFDGDVSQDAAKVVAGGGGGGAPGTPTKASGKQDDNFGGGGGDAQFGGDAAFNSSWNGGGAQLTQGGFAAKDLNCDPVQTAGEELQGGTGGTATSFEGGGGGGGGYWGGGGGRCQNAADADSTNIQNGGGGGGSGFLADDVTGGSSERGKNPATDGVGGDAGGMSDPFYTAGVGMGGGLTAAQATKKVSAHKKVKAKTARVAEATTPGNGADGEVVLQWILPDEVPGLPNTGDRSAWSATAGLGAIMVGAALVIGARRRYRAAHSTR